MLQILLYTEGSDATLITGDPTLTNLAGDTVASLWTVTQQGDVIWLTSVIEMRDTL